MKKIKDKIGKNQLPLRSLSRHWRERGLGRGILFFFILIIVSRAGAQTISYTIPDIGSSGQTTYIEIIGTYNQNGNFGADGIYANNAGDIVRVVCANSADTNKIKIGPVCVSWNGKMISTQVFVMPGINPNSNNWQLLSAAYQIPLQVVLNNSSFSNTDIFYIVQPQPAIITSGAVNLGGGGSGGIRSRRGAMIVDNFVLNSGANVTVSTADCDPTTAGNQGFLPIHVISRGTVFIDNGASVSVNAPGSQNPDGGPGGGGGGTESWTNNSTCAGGPNIAGSGFTGGGTEKACCSEAPGAGTGSGSNCLGCGGKSLNGVPGGEGSAVCHDADDGAGGTGHPFGSSGVNSTGPGGYGGGSGWSAYAGGGNASDGTAYAAGSQGKANGNAELTPFAGGGGASGGVAGPGTTRGGGGGGGGALSLHAYYSAGLQSSGQVNSNGGNGVLGATGYRGGGGGSGGTVLLSGKLNSTGTGAISVTGGVGGIGTGGQGGSGGAGRVRIDGPFTSTPAISPAPGVNSSSSYKGPSTDTSHFVARSFTLTGTGNGQAIRIYIKPITKPWQLLTTLSGYGTAWTQNIVLPCPDTLFLIAVAQNVPSPSSTQYTAEPAWAFSQAATNILIVKNALKAHAGDDVSICPASCIAIGGAPSATGGVPPYTYLWSPITGLNNSLLANPTACLLTNTTYALKVTDSSGCFHIDTVNVRTYPKPTAKLFFTNVCLNQTMNFSDSSTFAIDSIVSWSWDFGDSTPLNPIQNPSHTYTTPGTYTVSLIVATNHSCKDTITKSVVVHPLPNVQFTTANVCDGTSVQFTDSSNIISTDTIQSWTWDFADGSSLNNNQNTSHLYSAAASYAVQLLVISNFGCPDSITKTVIVHPNPISNFNNTSVCHLNSTQFTDSSTTALGTLSSWLWNFDDASPLNNTPSPSHLYANEGNYTVTLIVNNSFGCADTASKSVPVYFNPIAGFTYSDVCFKDSMHFVNTSSVDNYTSISSYSWVFGDGSATNNLLNPAHYYSNAGTDTVTMIATTADGCSDTSAAVVKTFDPPASVFSFNDICLYDSAHFVNTSTSPTMGSIASWSWNFGDGSPLNTTVWSPSHIFSNSGNYPITLITVSSNLGCPDTQQTAIIVPPTPVANFGFTDVCLNTSMNFYDMSFIASGSIASWSWDFGDSTSMGTTQLPVHNYSNPGTYTVILIVTTNNGCKDTITKNVVVHPLPSVYFNALDVCDNNPVYFNNFSSIPLTDTIQSYIWDLGDGSPLNNNQSFSHLYFVSGSYSVKLIVVSNFGCSDSITKTVIVHPNPVANFSNSSVCHTNTTQFTDSSTTTLGTMSTWSWNFGDGSPLNSTTSPSHLYANAGNHTVTLIVMNSFGCKDTITKPVKVYYNPVAGFTFNDVCLGDTMHFTNTSSVDNSTSITKYLWIFGDGSTTSSLQNPNHYYSSAGTYTVTLIVTTIDSCTNAITHTVNVFDRPTSAFTVNNTCLYDSALFTNTSVNPIMGSIASWSWDFGDGSPLLTLTPPLAGLGVLYAAPGNYEVTLIAYSSNLGCSDTLKDSITVFPLPVADFNFDNVCLYQTTTFTDLSTVPSGSITSRTWNFGDGTTPNFNPNPTHIFANAGPYTVSLIITTNNGCKDTMIKTVVVHPVPDAQFSATNVCEGNITQFYDLSTIPTTDTLQSWTWNFGDGSPLSSNQNPSHLYAAVGSDTVQLVVISSFGCEDSISKISVVNPNPVVIFSTPDTIGCEPLCVNFQNLSTIATGFNASRIWNFGDGNASSILLNPVHCYHNDSVYLPNSFNVTLTVTSDSGCVSTLSKNNFITVYPNPNASFTVQPQTTTITDPVISITNLTTGGNFWNWNFGDADTSSLFNPPSHTYPDTGIYIITLITSTQYNCADTMLQTIVIEPDFLFYIPNAFTPNDDGVNDFFFGKGIFITDYEMSIFDRWGNLIFYSDDINKQWDGKANHGTEIAQRDVYIYSFKVTDFQKKKHNYKGIVTLVR